MIHHSALSRKRLRSMKILDKSSCYVTALKEEFSSQELFDQFGQVLSFRVLKDTDPKQLYVRYTDDAAAADAVAWCSANPSAFEDAKHGFNRYCSKFIHSKECTNEACENRHSWAETKDILTFLERVPAHCPEASKAAAAQIPRRVESVAVDASRQGHQHVIALQDRIIDDLLREINDLKRLNRSLEHDVKQLNSSRRNCRDKNGHGKRGYVFSEQIAQAMSTSPMFGPNLSNGSCSPVTPEVSVYELGY